MDDLFKSTGQWFFEANQQPAQPTPDAQQVAFYIGMQCEELGEKVALVAPFIGTEMRIIGDRFKRGEFTVIVAEVMQDPVAVKELLDGDMDLIWVSIGAARAQGADFHGAFAHVSERNYDKRWEDGKFHNDPGTGKVLKPEGWTKPDLTPFVHPSLRAKPE